MRKRQSINRDQNESHERDDQADHLSLGGTLGEVPTTRA